MDIIYRNMDDFEKMVSSVVIDCVPWNGYTTCMWHNLKTCRILFDRNGLLEAAKNRFDVPYPGNLKADIILRNGRLLHGSLPSYEDQILKAVRRQDIVSINHRVSAFLESYFDLLFALNEQTHPGEKRLIPLCREMCTILPDHFEDNITLLLQHIHTEPNAVADDLNRILEALGKIL